MYNEGISREADIIQTGVKYGVVEKMGAWYSYKGEKLGQGVDASRHFLMENPKITSTIVKEILAASKATD